MARSCSYLVLAGMLILAACDGNSNDDNPALLRFLHAAQPGELDGYEDRDLLARLRYGETSSYLEVDPGSVRLEAEATVQGEVVFSAPLQALLEADSAYTAVVAGANDALMLLLSQDPRTTPAGGRARVRVAHAAFETGELELEILGDETSNEGVVFLAATPLQPGEISSSVLLDAGDYAVVIDEVDGSGDTVESARLSPGENYLFVVTDAHGRPSLDVIVATGP